MTLSRFILDKLEREHRGECNAIKRQEPWQCLRLLYPELSDREMREEYESLPLHGTNEGLFIPATGREKEMLMDLCMKKIKAYRRKWKVIKKYQVKDEPIQMRLFHG